MDVAISPTLDAVQGVRAPLKPAYLKIETVEQFWVEESRKNFADYFFYMTESNIAPHHIEWAFSILSKDSSKTNIIAPRESGKTSLLDMLMSWWIGKRPYTTNIIVCASYEQAKERLDDVRSIIDSEKFQRVFPHVKIDPIRPNNAATFSVWSNKWKNEDRIITYKQFRDKIRADKELSSKDYTMRAAGITSSAIPGKRFSGLVMADDLHDEKNSRTEEQRIKVEMLFKKTLIGCMTKKARIALICTRWAETDLSGRLMLDKRANGEMVWNTIEVKAIYEDAEGNPHSYWPEKWSIADLMDRRDFVGDVVFQLMYMNNPLGLSSGEITLDMLRQEIDWENLPDFDEVIITVDLARSLSDKADYTVFNLQAKQKIRRTDKNRYPQFNVYVFDIYRNKVGMDQCIKDLAEFYDNAVDLLGHLDGVLFEKQGFQPAWADSLKSYRNEIVVKEVSIRGDKQQRFKSAAAKAQAGKYFINTKMKHYHAMCSELVAFPSGKNDDIVDTFSLPYSYWGITTGRSSSRKVIRSQYLS